MTGKWEIVNGVKYEVDDHRSPRGGEDLEPYQDPSHLSRIYAQRARMKKASSPTAASTMSPAPPGTIHSHMEPGHPFNLRSTGRMNELFPKSKGTTGENSAPNMRTRKDFRRLKEQRSAITIQKYVRGALTRKSLKDETQVSKIPTCHPVGWTEKNHYSELGWMWCGQSCPCCRARAGDTLGACPICIRK